MDNASDTPCGCEQSSVSELSPGVVGDEEELHFLVCDPGGMLDGRLNPDFLRQLDKDGLSVLRGAAGNEEFTLTLAELKPRWAERVRRFHGVATFRAGQVRFENGERICCVYDTALEGKPNHAVVAGPEFKGNDRKKLIARRKKYIIDVMKRFETASEFRGGFLLSLTNDD